jgi:hypothetical protein
MQILENVLRGCESDLRIAQSPLEVQKGKVETSTEQSCQICEIGMGNSDLTKTATRVEMERRKAGAELLELLEETSLLSCDEAKGTTATRDGEKWSRGSVQTQDTRSVSSEGIRNEARRFIRPQ